MLSVGTWPNGSQQKAEPRVGEMGLSFPGEHCPGRKAWRPRGSLAPHTKVTEPPRQLEKNSKAKKGLTEATTQRAEGGQGAEERVRALGTGEKNNS